jgi:hypothetical protein
MVISKVEKTYYDIFKHIWYHAKTSSVKLESWIQLFNFSKLKETSEGVEIVNVRVYRCTWVQIALFETTQQQRKEQKTKERT